MRRIRDQMFGVTRDGKTSAKATAEVSVPTIPKPDWFTILLAAAVSAVVAFLMR